jgi:hypothetical protein
VVTRLDGILDAGIPQATVVIMVPWECRTQYLPCSQTQAVVGLHVKYPVLSGGNRNRNVSTNFSNTPTITVHGNPSSLPQVVTFRQTDIHGESYKRIFVNFSCESEEPG